MNSFEDKLRETLARHAAEAPRGQLLAEQIVREATAAAEPADARRRWGGWRTWTFPLIAAGAVGAVVAAIVGIENYHPSASAPAGTHSVVNPAPSSGRTLPSPTPAATTARVDTSTLHGVQILDLTFVGPNDGWALASADCVRGGGRCTAFLRTTDGVHWRSMPGPAFNVLDVRGCADPCVASMRFANDLIGYAFGPNALFMTTDGGLHWQRQSGGAIALETLDQNVIRLTSSHGGCPSWCNVRAETAAIGSTAWLSANVHGGAFGQQLSRGGSDAYLLFLGHPTGGSRSDGKSVLFRSTDDGRHWNSVGEPCPQISGEVDSHAVAAGGGNRVSVLCARRQSPQRWFVATSTDDGAHFTAQPGAIPEVAVNSQLVGDPATVLVSGGSSRLALSRDGGHSWQLIAGPLGQVTFAGFESSTVGRAVTDNRTIWTTRDAGRTWQPTHLG
jgi:hypothetical protein